MAEVILLKLQKIIMLAIGQWNYEKYDKPHLILYKIYSHFIFWHFFIMSQLVMISVPMEWKCKTRVVEHLSFYIQYTNNLIMMCLSQLNNMKKVFNYMLDYEKTKLNSLSIVEQNIYLRYAKLNNRFCGLITSVIFVSAAYWFPVSIRQTLVTEPTEECPIIKGTIYQIWHPFGMENYPWLLIINDAIFFITVVNTTVYREIMTISVVYFMLGQIKILQQNIRDLEKDSVMLTNSFQISFDQALTLNVKKCATKHQQLTELMRTVHSATNLLILVLYFSNTFEMTAFLFQLISVKSMSDILKASAVFLMMVMQVYIFYNSTNDVIVESTALSDTIYNQTNWNNYDQTTKINLLLMMRRSQKRLSFKAAGLGDVSLETFTKLIKLCYSIVACLKTTYEV